MKKKFPVIDVVATGQNIKQLREARDLSVEDVQNWFGFAAKQSIYKWQRGESLPTLDNLYALGALFEVPMEEILIPCKPELNIVSDGQQDIFCCPQLLLVSVSVDVMGVFLGDRGLICCVQYTPTNRCCH